MVLKRDYTLHDFVLTNDQVRLVHKLGDEKQIAAVPREVVAHGEDRVFACFVKKNDLTFMAVVKEMRVRHEVSLYQ